MGIRMPGAYIVAMSEDGIDLKFIGHQLERLLEEQRTIRREIGDMRSITLALLDQSRRAERRIGEVRDDLELLIKAELGGRLAHMETRLETRVDQSLEQLAERLHKHTP